MLFRSRPRAGNHTRRSSFLQLTLIVVAIGMSSIVSTRMSLSRNRTGWRSGPSWTTVLLRTDSSPEISKGLVEINPCEVACKDALAVIQKQLLQWEKVAGQSRLISGYGNKASRLLNRTLSKFDGDVGEIVDRSADQACIHLREVLDANLQRKLHSLFLIQRSTVEQSLYQNLRKELLRRMRRRKKDLDFTEKLPLLLTALENYNASVGDLRPHFVQDIEHARAEERLSELQWSIGDTIEAKEMKERWKMNKLMRMQRKQSRGISVSLSPGLRLLFRPAGLGNLQVWSKRLIGPSHNPSEVSIGVFNDGSIADVYNKKAKPPRVKIQPTIGLDMNFG